MEMLIMKKIIISMMAGAMLIFCGNLAQGREESKKSIDKQVQYKITRPERKVKRPVSQKDGKSEAAKRTRSTAELERGGRRDREMMIDRRLGAIQKQMEQKKKVHNAFVGQLKAIKNQAEKEGAQKTVAMLANLIAKEEKNTTESVKKLAKDKEKVAEQMEKYKQPSKVQPIDEKEAETEVKKTEEPKPAEGEKKKKKKWWKFGRD